MMTPTSPVSSCSQTSFTRVGEKAQGVLQRQRGLRPSPAAGGLLSRGKSRHRVVYAFLQSKVKSKSGFSFALAVAYGGQIVYPRQLALHPLSLVVLPPFRLPSALSVCGFRRGVASD